MTNREKLINYLYKKNLEYSCKCYRAVRGEEAAYMRAKMEAYDEIRKYVQNGYCNKVK